jgi:hypothetical protein
MAMKNNNFWDITPCTPMRAELCYLHHTGFLLGSFFAHEDGGDMFLRNVS